MTQYTEDSITTLSYKVADMNERMHSMEDTIAKLLQYNEDLEETIADLNSTIAEVASNAE